MSLRLSDRAVIVGACAYLLVLSLGMSRLSYDVWGVLVVLPPLAVLGYLGIRRTFSGELAGLANIMLVGFAAKGAGTMARYWVSFDAYGGATDAQRYHSRAVVAVDAYWHGNASLSSVLPGGTGTAFMERLTSFFYTFMGSSRLAAFYLFSFMSFWGVALFIRAACTAIPGLERRRYAMLCAFAPSLLYWPSSIGKEAWMMLCLGLASLGAALLVSRRGFVRAAVFLVAGIGGAALVRPHIGGLWLVGLMPALLVALLRGRGPRHIRGGGFADRLMLLLLTGIAVVAITAVGSATMRYLQPGGEENITSNSVTSILTETTRRTSEAGSNFQPLVITGPADWPYASLRTLVRPLLIEARGLAQLVSALELTLFGGLVLANLRRLAHLPRLVLTNPYVAFAMTVLFFGGLAYSSFANLGVLTRQKSLLFPMLLLVPCLPEHPAPSRKHPAVASAGELEMVSSR